MKHALLAAPALALLAASFAAACGGKVISGEDDGDSGVVVVTPADAAPPPVVDASADARVDAGSVIPGFDGGPTQPLEVLELGAVTAGAPVTFEIPKGTLGFHVTVESDTPSESLAVLEVVAPSGAKAHQNAIPAGGVHPTSETLFGTTAAVQIPQGELPETADGVAPGTWQVTFRGEGTLRAKVQVQTTPDGIFHGGTLDLDVYVPDGLSIAGTPPVSVGTAITNREVRDRIDAFFGAALELYGLKNGTVRLHGIAKRYTSISDDELFDVFRETRVAPKGQSLHVVLSEGDSEASEWWGIAAGIPGAANAPGNEQSGVALASLMEADAELEGYVLAHEAGHFLGLNHTTELSGEADPLSDTPVCTDISRRNLENCPDVNNVMFAAGAALGRPVASPLQRRVVQGSPVFKAFLTGTTPTPRGVRKAPDFGKLFGHPGVSLTRAESLVVAGMCRHASHKKPVLSAADRVALGALMKDTRISARLRGAGRRILAGE